MQVLRLEFPETKLGPYTFLHHMGGVNRDEVDRTPRMNTGGGRMPMFRDEQVVPRHYKFGFVNAEQANRWWDRTARQSAAKNGFKLAVYEVPQGAVMADDAQCVFDPRVAKLIAHIDPREWVEGDLNYLLQSKVYNDANSQRRSMRDQLETLCPQYNSGRARSDS